MKFYPLLLLILCACSNRSDFNYTGQLTDCLDPKDAAALNEACAVFEEILSEKYAGKKMEEAYIQFVKDFARFELAPPFFKDSRAMEQLSNLKSTGTFDRTWILFSEVSSPFSDEIIFEMAPNQPSVQEDYYIINPEGKFMTCVAERNKNHNIFNFIDFFTGFPGAATSWAALDLTETLTSTDLNEGIVRLTIAVCLYYNMVQMFEYDLNH